ncbi:MAG: hypothetical protein HY000_28865 [Planctomycetes bacterium]|nr:hypothetical protein [Planctomycetota bacterium]
MNAAVGQGLLEQALARRQCHARAAKLDVIAGARTGGYDHHIATLVPLLQEVILVNFLSRFVCVCALMAAAVPAMVKAQGYSTCETWDELVKGESFRYLPLTRVSDPGAPDERRYTGFWFYDELQFDEIDRYALAMTVRFQGRDVTSADRGEIGYFDLANGFKWTKIGETTAWNWQQGCRLQWRPQSSEILWNDRAEDGKHFVCRAYDFASGKVRTLPRPIYDVSPDGRFALTHEFARMAHGGTAYVGIPDPYADQRTPPAGVDKMDMDTGDVTPLITIERIARIAYPNGYKNDSNLYFFREGWNPSGTRFIVFLKTSAQPVQTTGWSISADGQDVRFSYNRPSHHAWMNDTTILEGDGFNLYNDDGTGKLAARLAEVKANTDPTFVPGTNQEWILGDTYPLEGYQHLFLYHRPSMRFVPLARLRNTAPAGIHRIDLHARTSRSGRLVCIDASHEGLGRQMYVMNIGLILDNPPTSRSSGG